MVFFSFLEMASDLVQFVCGLLVSKNFGLKALSPAKNNRIGSENVDCSRPQCLRPTVKSAAGGEEETYIVEAFVGMKKKSVGGRGLQIQYLVKWFGCVNFFFFLSTPSL